MISSTTYLKWLKRAFWAATGFYWVGLFILTHTPLPPPLVIVKSDKTAHFWGHGLLAAAVFTSLRLAGKRDPLLAVLKHYQLELGRDNLDFEGSEDQKNFAAWRGDAMQGAQP